MGCIVDEALLCSSGWVQERLFDCVNKFTKWHLNLVWPRKSELASTGVRNNSIAEPVGSERNVHTVFRQTKQHTSQVDARIHTQM